MSNRTITLNAAATAVAVAAAPKVRVRVAQDGTLQIRPTDRKSAVNLPKTETLRDLRAKDASRRFSIVDENLTVGSAYNVVAGKYGWFNLVPAASVVAGVPCARVSER